MGLIRQRGAKAIIKEIPSKTREISRDFVSSFPVFMHFVDYWLFPAVYAIFSLDSVDGQRYLVVQRIRTISRVEKRALSQSHALAGRRNPVHIVTYIFLQRAGTSLPPKRS